jgi:glycerol-3-phosphate acyltransferase PlsY
VLAALSLFVLALLTHADTARLAFALAIAALIPWTHRSNLARLRAGTESRFERIRLFRRRARR